MVKKAKGGLASIKKSRYAGVHIIADFWGSKIIEDPRKIKKILIETARKSKNISLGIKIHKFSPQGLTGFILLAESHISIHTWPELDYVAIDIFSCGQKTKPRQGISYLRKVFRPKKVRVKILIRGK